MAARRATRILLSGALGVALALVAVAGGRAEVVAPRVHDGRLALASDGTPFVAYVRGGSVLVARRVSSARWRAASVGSVPTQSRVMDFEIGARGPVVLVQSADDRTLVLVRRRATG